MPLSLPSPAPVLLLPLLGQPSGTLAALLQGPTLQLGKASLPTQFLWSVPAQPSRDGDAEGGVGWEVLFQKVLAFLWLHVGPELMIWGPEWN